MPHGTHEIITEKVFVCVVGRKRWWWTEAVVAAVAAGAAVVVVVALKELNLKKIYINSPMIDNPFQQQFSASMFQGGLLEAAIHIQAVTPAARNAKLVAWHKHQVEIVELTHAKFR